LGSSRPFDEECALVKVRDPIDKLAKLYVQNIVRLRGVPSTIISDRDSRFISRF